jgi:DNA ligase-1
MEQGLSEIYMIIRDIQNCSSTKAKQHIVKSNANNETFKKILMYAYNDMQYGVKKTTISKMEFNPDADYLWNNIWSMFEDLAKSNINNDLVLKISNTIGYFANENVRDLLIRVLLKDLKIGMNVKSINKAINGLIPMFDVMKASSYDDKNSVGFNKKASKCGYMMMIKENGIRGEIIKENGHIVVKSRQNKIVEGFDELDKAFQNMPDGYLYEGEILKVGEFNTSKEQFKETDKIYSIKGKKRNLMIKLFDLIPLDKFNEGEWGVKAIERKKMLKEFVDKNNHPLVQFADIIYQGTDISIIQKKLEEVSKDGYKEGLMVMLNDGKYEAKRTKLILKCKLFNTIDLRVVDIKESKEKPGTMGSAIVMYKGNTVGVSGWKEEDKIYYYQNPQELIGKIIEIKFKEVTVDKNGVESLQFPNVVRIRFDKDEESYE